MAAEHYEAIVEQHPRIIALHPLIKRQLLRSSKNNPRFKLEAEEGV